MSWKSFAKEITGASIKGESKIHYFEHGKNFALCGYVIPKNAVDNNWANPMNTCKKCESILNTTRGY